MTHRSHQHGARRHHARHHGDAGFAKSFGFGRGFGQRSDGSRRARRGDVRTALLRLLSERPMHGYDVIKELEERSGGMWRPSPGSIYPTLQLLEDEGLLRAEEHDGKRVYSITDAGRDELEERSKRAGEAPWVAATDDDGLVQLRDAGFKLAAAAMQVARTGSAADHKQAAEILADARRKLYALLAQ